jgi:uncharacterized membrane protein YfcA
VTAFALIIIGGGLMFVALVLRGQRLPKALALATALCGVVTTTAGALHL